MTSPCVSTIATTKTTAISPITTTHLHKCALPTLHRRCQQSEMKHQTRHNKFVKIKRENTSQITTMAIAWQIFLWEWLLRWAVVAAASSVSLLLSSQAPLPGALCLVVWAVPVCWASKQGSDLQDQPEQHKKNYWTAPVPPLHLSQFLTVKNICCPTAPSLLSCLLPSSENTWVTCVITM